MLLNNNHHDQRANHHDHQRPDDNDHQHDDHRAAWLYAGLYLALVTRAPLGSQWRLGEDIGRLRWYLPLFAALNRRNVGLRGAQHGLQCDDNDHDGRSVLSRIVPLVVGPGQRLLAADPVQLHLGRSGRLSL
jgi:hypothetical protein